MRSTSKLRGILAYCIGLISIVVVWWILSLFLEPVKMPSPVVVFKALVKSLYSYPQIAALGGGTRGFGPHLLYTLRNYFIATGIGITLGVAIGLLMSRSRQLLNLLEPILDFLRTIPSLAILPFFLMWFGPSAISQIALIILYCSVMVIVNTLNAVTNVNPIYKNFAMTLGADRKQMFRTIVVPAMIPELLGGIRVAMAVSWGFVVLAELMGSSYGLGKLFLIFIPYFHSTGIFVGIIWIILMAILTDALILRISRIILKWMPEEI